MQLGPRILSLGDNARIEVDYKDWLYEGAHLTGGVVTLNGSPHSTAGSVTLNDAKTRLIFFIQAGTVSEVFTVTVQATATDGQIVNDSILITVQNP